MRVAYLAGSGDVWTLYRTLAAGRRDELTSHVGYSELMLRACIAVGASDLLALTTHEGGDRFAFERGGTNVELRHMKDHFRGKRSLAFHAASLAMAADLRGPLAEFAPDVLVVPDDPPRAVAVEVMRPRGCEVIRVHHCALWPPLVGSGRLQQTLQSLDGRAMRSRFAAVLTSSSTVSRQIREVYGPDVPIAEFLPHYDAQLHRVEQPLPPLDGDLRAIYIGRVEADKGVFDLVEAALLLRRRGITGVSFDVCGVGGALAELDTAVKRNDLGSTVRLHGWCDRPRLAEVLGSAHMGIVPTRSELNEGFNQACIEMILAGRPVLTSRAIPAAEYVREATVVVAPDDPRAYADALDALCAEPDRVVAMHHACRSAGEKFLVEDTSFSAALQHCFRAIASRRRIVSREITSDGLVHGG